MLKFMGLIRFPTIRGSFLGVAMMRTLLNLGQSWGPNILESPFRVGLSPSGLRV